MLLSLQNVSRVCSITSVAVENIDMLWSRSGAIWVVVGMSWYRATFFFLCYLKVVHSVNKPLILVA